jgi:hypothetical protein
MTAIVLPTTSMPGQNPQEGGGRLINCFVESLGTNGPSQFKLMRVPGMKTWGTTAQTNFRGALQVDNVLYAAFNGRVVTWTGPGAATTTTGGLPGTDPVFWARDMATTPNVVVVSPDNGAFVVVGGAVSAFPDTDVGSPNSVCYLKGRFIFGYGNGAMLQTGLNSTTINTLENATAESKPDQLYRVIAVADTLMACGSNSIEFWRVNSETTGFAFSPVATHNRGIIHRYAIGGYEEGFGYGIFFVADDYSVRILNGYDSNKISPPDLDRLIQAVDDKETIQVSVYITQGHPFVVVQSHDWTWEYDVNLQCWHERQSYNMERWRGSLPFKAFDAWMCGSIADIATDADIYQLVDDLTLEDGEALPIEIITAPMGSFPVGARVNRLDLFVSAAVGLAPGVDPVETTPKIDISISKDLGISWSSPWYRPIGPQGLSPNVRVNNMGICGPKGVKFKFGFSDQVHFAMMAGDVTTSPLRN